MASIFTKIVLGELPSVKVAETNNCLAFMDINPYKIGHVLVIPKCEVDEIYELDEDVFSDLNLFAKKIATAMKKTFNSRIGMWVEGLDVPHAHIHLLPIESGRDFIFDYPRLKLSTEELQKIADNIKSHLK
jgi:histidine triad (HIT) family protein